MVVLQRGTMRLIYSLGPADPETPETPLYHGPENRGPLSVNLLGPAETSHPKLPNDTYSIDFTHYNVCLTFNHEFTDLYRYDSYNSR